MSISMTGAPLVIWEDPSLNVRVLGGNGRFEIRYPLIEGETGIPDFTTRADAIRYAERVADSIRLQRRLAHDRALKEEARRAAARTTTVDLVLRDATARRWVMVAPNAYIPADWVKRGRPFQDFTRRTRAQIEVLYGPVRVEHSIEIRGEVVA